MFTDNLFGGKPPAPGEPRRSPLGNLAASILAVDVKVDRHANDETVHVTKAEKEKLDRIPEGATANVQSDWDQSDSDADDFIRNKPPAMKNPAALTFGSKTYDGSAAQTLTAADLGALTSHQDISGKVDSSDLFSGGKVKAELLPSYVDDVLEYPSSAGFPSAGETGKIYVAKDTNKTYRWSGTQYVEVSPAPDLSNYVQKEAGKGLFSGAYDDLSGKPTIPAAVTVDDELSDNSENPVQNKVVTAALAEKLTRAEAEEGFTEWTVSGVPTGYSIDRMPYYKEDNDRWGLHLVYEPEGEGEDVFFSDSDPDSVDLSFTGQLNYASDVHITATRTRMPTMADVDAKENASNKVTSLSAQSTDAQYPSAKCVYDGLAGKADASSLPYALVTVAPTAGVPFVLAACFPMAFSVNGTSYEVSLSNRSDITVSDGVLAYNNEHPLCGLNDDGTFHSLWMAEGLTFNNVQPTADTTQVLGFTPTYALADRAINAVSLSATATLVMPAANAGHARDLVVRLAVGADGLNITWGTADANGVAVDYETEDGNFPDLSAAGTYLVRLTETAEFAAGTGGAADVPAKLLIQCQALQTAAAGGAA